MGRYSASTAKAIQTGVELAIPDEMSTPAWAETYRFVDRGARKGKWSNETVPFVTEIMACADDPAVREIVYQKPSQVAGSEVVNNIIGKRIQLAPTEIIYCAEKEDKAKAWTQESFDAMVRVTPTLCGVLSATHPRTIIRRSNGSPAAGFTSFGPHRRQSFRHVQHRS
jgi:phage terminase large subunit GpA-like protein